jgi:6-pyruvoyltetrahydropterin/6-carboxytetrahydropterin synthase
VEVELEAPRLDGEGMAFDFVELKRELDRMIVKVDHTYINEVSPFTDLAPSAENLARWFFEGLEGPVRAKGCRVFEVRVFEGRHSSASYSVPASL